MAKFLFGSAKVILGDDGVGKFYDILDPWELVTEEREAEFDLFLKNLVRMKSGELQRIFEKNDPE